MSFIDVPKSCLLTYEPAIKYTVSDAGLMKGERFEQMASLTPERLRVDCSDGSLKKDDSEM